MTSNMSIAEQTEHANQIRRDRDAAEAARKARGGTDDDHVYVSDLDIAGLEHKCQVAITGWVKDDSTWGGHETRTLCARGANARPHRAWWVTVTKIGRAYGGPEEGGWWYDYGQRELEIRMPANRYYEAKELHEHLSSLYPDHNYRSSVLPRGDDYQVTISRTREPEYWPQTRPHYE